jgi:hypothetical protein
MDTIELIARNGEAVWCAIESGDIVHLHTASEELTMDGALISGLKLQRQVDVIVPLRSNMVAFDDAVRLAEMAGKWHRHPSRATQQIALAPGVEHVWETCRVPLNACVMRYWHAKKNRYNHIVLVTTDQELTAQWIVKHYEQRPEIEQDYE